jgi:hypothetical protein
MNIYTLQNIINRGADSNSYNSLEQNGIHLAVIKDDVSMMYWFLTRGTNQNSKDIYGNTPFHYVNSKLMADHLLSVAKLGIQNNEGLTALDICPPAVRNFIIKKISPEFNIHRRGWMVMDNLDVDCMICLEPINETAIIHKERHIFHKKCLDLWAKQGQTQLCPICKDQQFGSKKFRIF